MTRAWAMLLTVLLGACTRSTPPAPAADPVPYYLVGARGTHAFEDPGGAARGAPVPSDRPLLPGFGMAIVEQRTVRGRRVGRTAQGRWLRMEDLEPAPGAPAAGVDLRPGQPLDFGWIVTPGAPALAAPTAAAPRTRTLPMHTRLRLRGPCPDDLVFCRTEAGWVRTHDLRVPAAAPRPPGVAANEIWIDVDLRSNTLVVHEGDRPVFATLVATGTGRPGTRFATPPGIHRIHTKARTATMDNLEHTDVLPYSYEDIPHVQYFTAGVALHAALWHGRFGHPMSHGCINMAPDDAARLFALTRPALPEGEDRVSATSAGGTVIRVR